MDTKHNETIAGLPAQLPDPRNPNQSLPLQKHNLQSHLRNLINIESASMAAASVEVVVQSVGVQE